MDDYAQGGHTSTLRATADGERAQVLVSRLKVTLTCKDCECSQACCLLKLFGLDVQQG